MPGNHITFGTSSGDKGITRTNIRLSIKHGDAAIAGCFDRLGAGLFLSYQIQDLVTAGQLQIILSKYEPEPLLVALVCFPSRRFSARTRTFIAWANV